MGTVDFLLDTHTLLGALRGNQKLSNTAKDVIENANSKKFISAISAYEIMYKYQLGKLKEYKYVVENYFNILESFSVSRLPINERHTHFAGKLEWSHRDPFDRLLAAQSHIENLTLITNDPAFQTLSWVNVLW